MKVAYYTPNAVNPRWCTQFCDYLPDVTWLYNKCDETVDFVYCGSASISSEALAVARKYNKPFVCWVWDLPDLKIFPDRVSQYSQLVNTLRQADLVLSASKYTQSILEGSGIQSKQLYFYVDTSLIATLPDIDKKAPTEEPHVIQVSRFIHHKQFEVSIEAMAGLTIPIWAHGPIAGASTHYINALRHRAANFGVPLFVRQGWEHRDVLLSIKRASVLVAPTKFEGWGVTPAEAAFCGTPIVVSDLSVFREQYGDDIPYHKIGDVEGLREQIRILLTDENEASRVVNVIQEKTKTFTPQAFAERWLKAVV